MIVPDGPDGPGEPDPDRYVVRYAITGPHRIRTGPPWNRIAERVWRWSIGAPSRGCTMLTEVGGRSGHAPSLAEAKIAAEQSARPVLDMLNNEGEYAGRRPVAAGTIR